MRCTPAARATCPASRCSGGKRAAWAGRPRAGVGVHGAGAGGQQVWEAAVRWKWRPVVRAAAQLGRDSSSVEGLLGECLAAAVGSPCMLRLGWALPALFSTSSPWPTPNSLQLDPVASQCGRHTQGAQWQGHTRQGICSRHAQHEQAATAADELPPHLPPCPPANVLPRSACCASAPALTSIRQRTTLAA